MVSEPNITHLEELVASLPVEDGALFRRIYAVDTLEGELSIPRNMELWVRQRFGSVETVTKQQIVRVTNQVTQEEALFNRLRHHRPTEFQEKGGLASQLSKGDKEDLFASPGENTPEDLFGRISGRH